jgi:calcineurin-like phosphoesterase family protein
MRYFTSDHHFFDSDIMSYCDRPYESVEYMNDEMVRRFREKTADASEIYILGDIFGGRKPRSPFDACRSVMETLGIRARPFHLVLGNHDTMEEDEYKDIGFSTVKKTDFITLNGMKVMLTHDPCMVQPLNTLAICGHIHTLFSENWQPVRNTFTINVGVDVRNYEPVSESDILDLIESSDYRR